MANAVLNSNSSSALVSALDSVSSSVNPFQYSYASKGTLGYSHVPAHARIISVSETTSPGFGRNNDFAILKSGHLENAFVKMVVKNESGAAADYNAFIGNLQVAEIQLITQGKVICSSKPFGRACLMSDAPYGRKKNQEKGYGLQGSGRHADIADDAETTFYVPLGFACFDSPANFIDTNFTEPLVVRVRLEAANTYANASASAFAAVSLSLSSLQLVQIFRMLPSDLEQKTIEANYQEEDLVRVMWDLVEESSSSTPTAAVSQVLTHTITTNRCVSKLFIAIEDTITTAGADTPGSQGIGDYLELSNIKIEANGQALLDIDAGLIAYMSGTDAGSVNSPNCVGNYWDTSYSHSQNIYCIDFGLLKGTDHFSGMVSARELNNWKVSATSSSSTALIATAHNLRVCMVCPQLESTSSASGKVSTSLSS
tara:strand:+ start:4409 stop:5689 length:1281 start_codon:yes stop_codon:yes gene_type:complete